MYKQFAESTSNHPTLSIYPIVSEMILQDIHVTFASLGLNILLLSVFLYHTYPVCDIERQRLHQSNKVKRSNISGAVQAVKTTKNCGNPLVAAKKHFWAYIETTVSDKFHGHTYQWAYYKYLYPLTFTRPKILEIGIGCGMVEREGASVGFWLKYFGGNVDLWMFEYDAVCVERFRKTLNVTNVGFTTGDQADLRDLTKLIDESGGEFDVIIDDGGHTSLQQTTSLNFLFAHLKSGSHYFVEDIQWHSHVDPFENMLRRVILHNVQTPLNTSATPVVDPAHLVSMECFRELCVFNKI